ncbi:single-stranded DNA-binding protein [Promicromonospora sp. AC04]|uniref:single-stranded DNA-binding protein n=1 Tax=Promicromonospora sp. AC04 TaxID=2135723 RepID=UPI000D3687B4|nr:single-stranded DNA-binding protein [Promicromonospora sp. AC04]PUB32542.1 single-stranded DNA-binding protein [Promicromonospora sp. AC04]
MSNPRNNGTVVGRLANDPKVFENKDGSKKVLFTVFADRNYTNAQNERQSDGIPVEAFVRSQTQGLGPYSNIHKGDLVAVGYTLRMDRYSKNGEQIFDLKVTAEDITFLEPRSVTQARLAERVVTAEAENQAIRREPALAVAPAAQPAAASAVQDEQLPFGA